MSAWDMCDPEDGIQERVDLGKLLVAWVWPIEGDAAGEDWTGPSAWALGTETDGMADEPMKDGSAPTRAEARREVLEAARALLVEAASDLASAMAEGPESGAKP